MLKDFYYTKNNDDTDEHLYINEWVSHYFSLGVDKIFLFDNDDKGSPYIGDFIDKAYLPKIKIINARGVDRDGMQHDFYTNFYNIQKDNFDWCLFCDIDEFLLGTTNIKQFLSNNKFKNFEQIRIKWKMFGDNDLITRDMSNGLIKTFTKEVTTTLSKDLSKECGLLNQGKAIVRGHLKDISFNSVHFATRKNKLLVSCLPSGKPCVSLVEIKEDYSNENIFLNHYMTKSLSEFVNQKMNRTDAVFGQRNLKLNYYWRINRKTPEKIEYIKNLGLE